MQEATCHEQHATCHTSMSSQALEDFLSSHHVRYLVLPSIKSLLPMWQGSFRFARFTMEEQTVGRRAGAAGLGCGMLACQPLDPSLLG